MILLIFSLFLLSTGIGILVFSFWARKHIDSAFSQIPLGPVPVDNELEDDLLFPTPEPSSVPTSMAPTVTPGNPTKSPTKSPTLLPTHTTQPTIDVTNSAPTSSEPPTASVPTNRPTTPESLIFPTHSPSLNFIGPLLNYPVFEVFESKEEVVAPIKTGKENVVSRGGFEFVDGGMYKIQSVFSKGYFGGKRFYFDEYSKSYMLFPKEHAKCVPIWITPKKNVLLEIYDKRVSLAYHDGSDKSSPLYSSQSRFNFKYEAYCGNGDCKKKHDLYMFNHIVPSTDFEGAVTIQLVNGDGGSKDTLDAYHHTGLPGHQKFQRSNYNRWWQGIFHVAHPLQRDFIFHPCLDLDGNIEVKEKFDILDFSLNGKLNDILSPDGHDYKYEVWDRNGRTTVQEFTDTEQYFLDMSNDRRSFIYSTLPQIGGGIVGFSILLLSYEFYRRIKKCKERENQVYPEQYQYIEN